MRIQALVMEQQNILEALGEKHKGRRGRYNAPEQVIKELCSSGYGMVCPTPYLFQQGTNNICFQALRGQMMFVPGGMQ